MIPLLHMMVLVCRQEATICSELSLAVREAYCNIDCPVQIVSGYPAHAVVDLPHTTRNTYQGLD